MSVGTAVAVGLGVAAIGGGVATAAIGAHAAGKAADAQVNAANHAADLQHEDAQNALDFNKQQYNTSQAELKPWLTNGYSSLSNLQYLMGTMQQPGSTADMMRAASGIPTASAGNVPAPKTMGQSPFGPHSDILTANPRLLAANADNGGDMAMGDGEPASRQRNVVSESDPLALDAGPAPAAPDTQLPAPNTSLGAAGSLLAPFGEKFQAPDAITEQNDPGFKARLALGATAMDNSAAARGRVLSGGATKDLNQFAQDYGSNEYGNVYARAFNEYANRYNQFKQQQTDVYNKLAGQAGLGQTTASTMGLMGQNAANTNSNIALTSGAQIGQDLNNAGAARASGYIGGANAINNGITGTTSNLMNLAFLSKLFGSSGTSGGGGGVAPGWNVNMSDGSFG